ncbi:MAG: tetratricopeptide repeat protein [Bacteroidia bacterium]|nr:tetratricopeptide repeat protein [Bacteroidia bacterium]NNF31303.1 tetratricopeptide repeat protein [Flavobacteriaceae bacterium]MBT8274605.1 tetratricopeptide repeat protein [Bacteroidia bacterium]NNJ82133.1 tetratricopeptide repeat protein [Flavobacteriaceae bacterium]NNK54225.1 tetratricopeptide repeat protein [Flavobacteriaceae bacterium]
MKKQLLLAGLFCISAIAFGQKKEIKKAEKALKAGNASEAISYINQAEGLLSNADGAMKSQFYMLKGKAFLAEAGTTDYGKLKTAAEAFKMANESGAAGKTADEVAIGMQNLRVALVNSAVADQNAKNYAGAAEKLYTSYTIQKDTSDLYYAAGNAVNAKDYEKALMYYKDLLDQGYTGIRKEFVAIEIETGKEVVFASESDRNTNMLTGKYTNPTERMSQSVRGDVLQKVTLIYISRNENEKALALMKEAREANPDDKSLLRAEADMAYKMGDMEKYSSLMEEIIAADPNNPELYYNLGVGSANKGDKEKALSYYKKALELDPDFTNAKINIAATILAGEGPIIEEMNSLGTSNADYDRYDELKEVKNGLYREAMPYLEAASADKPDNLELIRTLMNIYSQLGEDDKHKAAKAKLDALEGGE